MEQFVNTDRNREKYSCFGFPSNFRELINKYKIQCANKSLSYEHTYDVFSSMCPSSMEIIRIGRELSNVENNCRWLVRYQFKETPDVTPEQNEQRIYNEILKYVPINCEVVRQGKSEEHMYYEVIYSVNDCVCPREKAYFYTSQCVPTLNRPTP